MAEPTREEAWDLVCEWVESDSLRKHLLGVEAGMVAYARKFGEDEERWAVTALVHDLDYERYPDLETGHPRYALKELEERGYPQDVIDAVAGHAPFLGVPRETQMAKTLFAVDELSGFISACALVRPTGIEGMKPKSVKKKLKQPSFAAGVNRDEVAQGAEEMGVDFDEHVAFLIEAMAERSDELGPGPARRRRRARLGMKTRWKVLIGLAVVLVALLGLNTIVLNQQTKGAEVTVDGGEIISLPGGDVQVLDTPAPADATGAPIVLIHCYLCSLQWWDELAPLLAENHRVIRIDLLGFGGSEKPSSGYAIQDQAALVAGHAQRARASRAPSWSGQSMGAGVAVALAEQSSQLVDRVVAMNQAPTNDAELPALPRPARLRPGAGPGACTG